MVRGREEKYIVLAELQVFIKIAGQDVIYNSNALLFI